MLLNNRTQCIGYQAMKGSDPWEMPNKGDMENKMIAAGYYLEKLPGYTTRRQNTDRVQVSPRKHNWEPGEPEGPSVHKAEYQYSSKSFCMTWSNHLLPALPPWESVLKFIFPAGQTMCSSLSIPLPLLSAVRNFSHSPTLDTKVSPADYLLNEQIWLTEALQPQWSLFWNLTSTAMRTPNFLPLDSTRAVVGWIIPPPKLSMSKSPKPEKMSPHLVKGKMWLGS